MTERETSIIKVLFVCLGNICRSPMAEAVFNQKVRAAGLGEQIYADSAGTGGWHVGQPPHRGTLRVLAARGIPCSHRGRQIERSDLNEFDYVVVMDASNLADVQALGSGKAKVVRLLEYARGAGIEDVPDPYYGGGFEGVYTLIDFATTGLLRAICEEHGLGE